MEHKIYVFILLCLTLNSYSNSYLISYRFMLSTIRLLFYNDFN